ncbi:ATP-binding protein [Pyrobaculum calidifontis]|uniref:ATPase domain-containing protein n=1 Tax=Pyrobaculum calidifontis (strain DSM 21063 / JCM 11548 / VA1) TaxID=410359 RepID=A3MTD3_PYRCJ|nr:ATP-binding protein [Pyrobaculum calidifontis]ABO07900.1 Protein of unknown function DUF1245 [Pyrobaculum calidifontis JCM 11548]
MKRIKLIFAGRDVEFTDRDVALEQIAKLAERGTYTVHVVYGPEGCGKTALLKQAKAVLEEEFGYHVLYANPLAKRTEEILQYSPSARELVEKAFSVFSDPLAKAVDLVINVAGWIIQKFHKAKVAVLMDDIFQAIGVENAEAYVKALLNLIEWPPAEYDKIVVLVASSEGITRERVGRHRWATIKVMWNMSKDGFRQLYDVLPDPKPPFDDVWRWTGGNPDALEGLFEAGWDVERVVEDLAVDKGLSAAFAERWRAHLAKALEDPDYLWEEPEAEGLAKELVEKNLVVLLKGRRPDAWVDQPPPERDPELGIGKHYAWQTPLHREAVRRALEQAQKSA